MHVLLTGVSGFVGGHLVRELRAAGCEVKALSRRHDAAKRPASSTSCVASALTALGKCTPGGAMPRWARMTCARELGYVETPLDTLLADTLQWMKHEGMLGS